MKPRPLQSGDLQIVIVGGGIAGLATALHLAPMPVTLITAAPLGGDCATGLAQGGIAAALGPADSPSQHAADTGAASASLGDATVASTIARAAPEAIDWLLSQGVRFDRDRAGKLALGLEAAHSNARIVHADGDRTGREILRALIVAVRASPSISVIERAAVRVLTQDCNGAIDGLLLQRGTSLTGCAARAVVLATGGVGGLFAHTTNPLASIGSGLALGARAGAVLRDLEFVQFHPTALDIGRDPMPLATEALRGEGARLVNRAGDDVMAHVRGGALAARDVVARVLAACLAEDQSVFLELPSELARDLPRRFPGIAALCTEANLDLSLRRIPVRPAAHYHMGGLKVDARGRTSVEGLWACGEIASTGLHGGNRLASNSLLEALVCADAIAQDLTGTFGRSMLRPGTSLESETSATVVRNAGPRASLRHLMDRHVGVVRDEQGLIKVVRTLAPLAFARGSLGDPELVAVLIALSALERRESRGAHRRADYASVAGAPRSQELTLDTAQAKACEIVAASARPLEVASP